MISIFKHTLKLSVALAFVFAMGAAWASTSAYADGGSDDGSVNARMYLEGIAPGTYLGTIETAAVTQPYLWGGVLYIPASATGGGEAQAPIFLGTVETAAVTQPYLYGGVLYVPMGYHA